MDINNIDHLLEALYRTDAPHGTIMNTQRQDEDYMFNWLDAATPPWLAENADKIILACASKMAIRHMARQEDEFIRNGYSGSAPVDRGVIVESIIKEAEKHTVFYMKARERLEKLVRLDSINRRSEMAVLRFPAKATERQLEPGMLGNDIKNEGHRDLVQVYEQMRRSHIAGNARGIVSGPGDYGFDWLDNATQAELEESTDTILFASAARMAIRMSLRLERGWRQHVWINQNNLKFKTDLLHDLRMD